MIRTIVSSPSPTATRSNWSTKVSGSPDGYGPPTTVKAFATTSLDYLEALLNATDIPVDELLAANLRYTAALIGIAAAERGKRIATALDRVGLSDVATTRVGTFSRGMRQRLGLAEILMKEAQIAILDEPTSGLDPQATAELLNVIRDLKNQGVSVLLSSHLLERVQSVCDRVALFSQGNIVLIGTVPELGRQVLGGGFRVEVEAQGQGLEERIGAIPGVQRVEPAGANRFLLLADHDVRPEAASAVVAAGGRLLRLSVEEPSLEAIYTRYFQTLEGELHAA